MDRKYGILQKRMEAAETALVNWLDKMKHDQAHMQQELDSLNKYIAEFEEMLDKTRQEIEQEQMCTTTVPGRANNGGYGVDRQPRPMQILDIFSQERIALHNSGRPNEICIRSRSCGCKNGIR